MIGSVKNKNTSYSSSIFNNINPINKTSIPTFNNNSNNLKQNNSHYYKDIGKLVNDYNILAYFEL